MADQLRGAWLKFVWGAGGLGGVGGCV
jgi:hypothetical protein